MTLSWSALLLLCLAGAVLWFWQDSLAARELANRTAVEACERLALQFLDGTVAFARVSIGRGRHGRLVLRRTYVFDYTSNSIDRRQGFVVVSERSVETVGYAQDEQRPTRTATRSADWPVDQAERPSEQPTQQAGEIGRIIQLSDRRKQSDSNASPEKDPSESGE